MTTNYAKKAPFPWFGGKSAAAETIWRLLGDVDHYVEPFCGTLTVLLNRPHKCNRAYYSETVNDVDGLLVNFWRAVQWHPEETARHASWPVSEADKQARGIALLRWREEGLVDLLAGSPEWCDPKMAGWWVYVVCCTIGAFAGDGAWTVDRRTDRIVKQALGPREPGVFRNLPHLIGGMGVNTPQLREPGVTPLDAFAHDPSLADIGDWGAEFHDLTMPKLIVWFRLLAARLRHVRIINGDWARAVTTGASHTLSVRQGGVCGYLLDPPYADTAGRAGGLYLHESDSVAHAVCEWCLANGDKKRNRIVLCGFEGEHGEKLKAAGWSEHEWFKKGFLTGGMGQLARKYDGEEWDGEDVEATHQQHRERLFASPHCLNCDNTPLFDGDSL